MPGAILRSIARVRNSSPCSLLLLLASDSFRVHLYSPTYYTEPLSGAADPPAYRLVPPLSEGGTYEQVLPELS